MGELLRRWMPVYEGVRCDVQVTLRANSITVQSGSDQGSSQASLYTLRAPEKPVPAAQNVYQRRQKVFLAGTPRGY